MTRGNHENRGAYAQHWLDYFPTPTGETYYTFRRGPAFFIVLDGCEDKPTTIPAITAWATGTNTAGSRRNG